MATTIHVRVGTTANTLAARTRHTSAAQLQACLCDAIDLYNSTGELRRERRAA